MATAEKSVLGLIEKVGLLLYTASALGSLLFWNVDIFLGVLAGGAFALLNFRALRMIAGAVFKDPENPRPGYFALLVPKFTLIGVVLWLCVKYRWFDMVAFAAGTLCLFLAIVGVGLLGSGAPPEQASSDDDAA